MTRRAITKKEIETYIEQVVDMAASLHPDFAGHYRKTMAHTFRRRMMDFLMREILAEEKLTQDGAARLFADAATKIEA